VAEIRAIVQRIREIVTFVKSHKDVQAMFDKTCSPSIKALALSPSKRFSFVALMLQHVMANRATFDAILGERLEKWSEATSSVDTRVVENVEQTLKSYVFWKQAESALALLQPLSDAIHYVKSDDCKLSWVFPLVNALLADCIKWSETAGDLYREDTKHQVIKAIRDPLVALKSDVVLFAGLVDPNTCPCAGDPRPDNILETAGRFLTKYIDRKDIPQELWRNSTGSSCVRESLDAGQVAVGVVGVNRV
jgi:hypothetical protein